MYSYGWNFSRKQLQMFWYFCPLSTQKTEQSLAAFHKRLKNWSGQNYWQPQLNMWLHALWKKLQTIASCNHLQAGYTFQQLFYYKLLKVSQI